jgi:hypothetical protein
LLLRRGQIVRAVPLQVEMMRLRLIVRRLM